MTTQKVLRLQPRKDFVLTPAVEKVCRRAMRYLDAGYACHFRGSAGTGKTTLAMHVANQRGRPVVLLFGDEEFGTSDLVGAEKGLVSTKVTDNYVRSVSKTEEFRRPRWVDSRLTTACKHGYTLVYDEFSRSRPEANNVLLTILEERILPLPDTQHGATFIAVHPEFRAVFTSNPSDYVGVHKTQDALLDRMITIELDQHDRDTEIAITCARAGVEPAAAAVVVDLVHRIRAEDALDRPTLRASIMIARIMREKGCALGDLDGDFVDLCVDVLQPGLSARQRQPSVLRGLVRRAIHAIASHSEESRHEEIGVHAQVQDGPVLLGTGAQRGGSGHASR